MKAPAKRRVAPDDGTSLLRALRQPLTDEELDDGVMIMTGDIDRAEELWARYPSPGMSGLLSDRTELPGERKAMHRRRRRINDARSS